MTIMTTSECKEWTKWKDALLEAALTESPAPALEQHLLACVHCRQKLSALRARRKEMDELLPRLAQGAEPAADFRARVLAATEKLGSGWRAWRGPWRWAVAVAGVALVFAGAMVLWPGRVGPAPGVPGLEEAEKLAQWRAPTDALLKTPGHEFLGKLPKFGESYIDSSQKLNKEK